MKNDFIGLMTKEEEKSKYEAIKTWIKESYPNAQILVNSFTGAACIREEVSILSKKLAYGPSAWEAWMNLYEKLLVEKDLI